MKNKNSLSEPLVSIIMGVYNCENYIKRCIVSILKQTYTNFLSININKIAKIGFYSIIVHILIAIIVYITSSKNKPL